MDIHTCIVLNEVMIFYSELAHHFTGLVNGKPNRCLPNSCPVILLLNGDSILSYITKLLSFQMILCSLYIIYFHWYNNAKVFSQDTSRFISLWIHKPADTGLRVRVFVIPPVIFWSMIVCIFYTVFFFRQTMLWLPFGEQSNYHSVLYRATWYTLSLGV